MIDQDRGSRSLRTYDRSDHVFAIAELYAASHHSVLSLYGRLANLIAAR